MRAVAHQTHLEMELGLVMWAMQWGCWMWPCWRAWLAGIGQLLAGRRMMTLAELLEERD